MHAYELAQASWPQTAIAEALGVTQSAVSKWLKAAAGPEALRARNSPGRPVKLTAVQRETLVTLLTQGAEAHGFDGDVWTSARVAMLITRQFGVTLCDRQVRRLLRQLDWSRQTPTRQADQRDEEAILRWVRERWPTLKTAKRARRTILFVDECGVYLVPAVVKTWAPRGQPPVLHQHLTNDHLSAISAVSPEGDLYFQVQRHAYDSMAVLRFLEAVHSVVPGKLLVIWDGAPIHRSDLVQAYLIENRAWLQVEPLPGYASDLNPDEGIWRYLKYVELNNQTFATLGQLESAVNQALQHIQQLPEIMKATFREAGLAL
jgi:transposase